jgi:hypothetical protein
MKLNDAYPSRFLTAEDLNGKDIAVTIASVELEDIGQGHDKSKKLVISMTGKKKAFVVNKTNAGTIAKVLGTDETEEWVDRQIIIGPREVEFQGNMVWSIRVSLKKPATAAAKPAPAAPADDFDDVPL